MLFARLLNNIFKNPNENYDLVFVDAWWDSESDSESFKLYYFLLLPMFQE
jgi:hypothetical protein